MPAISRLRSLWRNVIHRDRAERDLDDEVRAVVDLLVDEKASRGMSREEAQRAATIELGRVDSIKSRVRDVQAGAFLDVVVQDVRYGARLLWRNPIFTLTAALSLAICIAANTTVFSIANRLLLREAAGVDEPDRLVDIAPVRSDGRFYEPMVPYRMYAEIRDRVTTLEGVYGYELDLRAMSLRGPAGAERIFSTFVTSNYFSVLGIRPAAGRLLGLQDSEESGGSEAVVLSHGFWKRRFNADPGMVGQTVHINGQPLTVVGVTPEEFQGLSLVVADVWLPTSLTAALTAQGSSRLAVGGRLGAGGSISQAAAEVDAIGRVLQRDVVAIPPHGTGDLRGAGGSFRLVAASPLPPIVRVLISGFLALLLGIVSLVLIIACANVAGVLLARGAARRQEVSIRLAIGAGRSRLIRQLLTETVLLFMLGGAGGLVLARVMTSLVVLALPPLPVPVDTSLPLDGRVFAFTAVVSLVAALLSGLVPALQTSRADLISALKAASRESSDRLRLRSAFVVAQVAFSILLVVSAGLLGRALQRSGSVDLGFDSDGIGLARMDLTLGGYTSETGPQFVRDLLERLRTIPGVRGASAATILPHGGQMGLCCGVTVPGVTRPDGQPFQPAWNIVEPHYFGTLGIRLSAGRDFSAGDRKGTELVTIINEAAARLFWPGENPLNRHVIWQKAPRLISRQSGGTFKPPPLTPVPLTIVGVADDVDTGSPSGPRPRIYIPFQQQYESGVTILARSSHGQRLTAEIRDVVASANPNLPIVAASRLADQTSPVLMQLRLSAAVSAGVGLVALLLAAIGIYGVTAYTVTRRTREIGIRVAMGAQRADVIGMVLRQGMSLVLVGAVIGLLLAAAGSRLLVRLLFGVPPLDPATFAGAVLLFAVIGLAACYMPTRRATRINATEALRYE